ncbi:MAG: hypothetical protein JWM40_468 [Frankiales bacterium]|nr:hypothetical protein [Frankiales bacterium]
MISRQHGYFVFRGGSAVLFLLSATALPRPNPAAIGCLVAGIGGLMSCIGVNAGGPGEQAGAAAEQVVYDRTRAPQGDWPPFPEDRVIEGELKT